MQRELLLQANALLEEVTPLVTDCGLSCGKACCQASDAGEGMLLLPGEAELLPDAERDKLWQAHLTGFGDTLLYACQGPCDRHFRPFACRVFPLAPKWTGEGFTVRMDVRGRPVCPLSRQSVMALSPAFRQAVEQAYNLLAEDEEYKRYLRALSRLVRRYEKLTLKG